MRIDQFGLDWNNLVMFTLGLMTSCKFLIYHMIPKGFLATLVRSKYIQHSLVVLEKNLALYNMFY